MVNISNQRHTVLFFFLVNIIDLAYLLKISHFLLSLFLLSLHAFNACTSARNMELPNEKTLRKQEHLPSFIK